MHIPPARQLPRDRLLRISQLPAQGLGLALATPGLLLALLVLPLPRLVQHGQAEPQRPARRAVERVVAALGVAADSVDARDGLRGAGEGFEDGLDVVVEREEGGEEGGVRGGVGWGEGFDVGCEGGYVPGREEGEGGEAAGEEG